MTIGANNRMDYTGNGATGSYSYNFKIFAATDLRVTVRDTEGGETELTYPTHFTVSGVGAAAGGSAVLVDGAFGWVDADGNLKEDYALTIRRVRPLTQLTDIRNQTQVFNDVLEDTYDHLMMVDQQQQGELDRALKLAETDDDGIGPLPLMADRVGMFLAFDADGNPTASNGTGADSGLRSDLAAADGSALAGFQAAGGSAVQRSVRHKLLDFISVKDFGAVGDGSTDDTAAFVAALSDAAGKGIFIPAGTYVLDGEDPGLLPASYTHLFGAGRIATMLLFKNVGADNNAIYASQKTGIRIFDLTIKHDTALTGNQGAVYFDDCDDCQLENVDVENFDRNIWFYSTLVDFTKNKGNKAINCRSKNSNGYGFYVRAATGWEWLGCYAEGARSQDGFKTGNGSRDGRISSCYSVGNNRDGFDFYDGFIRSVAVGNVAVGNTLNGFEIKGTLNGEYSSGDYVIRDSIFNGNIALDNTLTGIVLSSVRNLVLSGNAAISNGGDGWLLGGVQGCAMSGNIAAKNALRGFNLLQDVTRTDFVSCRAVDNSWVDGSTQNGIYDGFYVGTGCAVNFVACGSLNGTTTNQKGGQRYGWYFDTGASGSVEMGCSTTANVTGGFGGYSGWATANPLFNCTIEGVFTGIKLSSDALSALTTALSITVSTSGSNASLSASRASGAALTLSAQASVGSLLTTTAHPLRLGANGTALHESATGGAFQPVADDAYNNGGASNRWDNIHCANGTIVTSDGREKQQVRELIDAERAVAVRLKGLLRAFKFNRAVGEKGDGARIHFGVIAQDVIAAFAAEGLDATEYGLLCYDEWEAAPEEGYWRRPDGEEGHEGDGESSWFVVVPAKAAGNRYGVRYEELHSFMLAAL